MKNIIKLYYYLYFRQLVSLLIMIPTFVGLLFLAMNLLIEWTEPAHALSTEELLNEVTKDETEVIKETIAVCDRLSINQKRVWLKKIDFCSHNMKFVEDLIEQYGLTDVGLKINEDVDINMQKSGMRAFGSGFMLACTLCTVTLVYFMWYSGRI